MRLTYRVVPGLLVLVGVLAAGCGQHTPAAMPQPATSSSTSSSSPVPASSAQSGSPAALAASIPTRMRVPSINADSSLIPLGLDAKGEVEVPALDTPLQAGWYSEGPTPGEAGGAVILGHVDGNKKPGIFYRLREVKPGAEVLVDREDGTRLRFVVSQVKQIPKTGFPTDEVYSDAAQPLLRLVTCGGSFEASTGQYRDNIIAFAELAP